MIPKATIEAIAAKQRKMLADIPAGHPREITSSMPYLTDKVLLIGGMRGSGRATLLRRLLRAEYPEAWYTDFDDPRLAGFDEGDFVKLDRLLADSGRGVLVLNAVDNTTGWAEYLKSKTEQGIKAVVSVSLATLTDVEAGDRGAPKEKFPDIFITRRLEPFSYGEFLDFTHRKGGEAAVADYMAQGSLPGALKTGKIRTLQRLYTEIVTRDIIVAGGVRDRQTLQRVVLQLITGSGGPVTANRLRDRLKIKAVSTAAEHMLLAERAGLVSFVPILSDSPARQAVNPRIVYAADTALLSAVSLSGQTDRGQLFATMIFNHLRSRSRSVCYTLERGGCDFVATDADGIVRCVQACYDDDPDLMEAKTEGLWQALRLTGTRQGTIVTPDRSGRLELDGMEIGITDADSFLSGAD